MLERLLEATGADRAYLIRQVAGGAGGAPVIEAFCARRRQLRRFSRTVLLRSLDDGSGLVCTDASGERRLLEGASVRSLALRSVFSARVPRPSAERRALVVDSRTAPVLPERQLRDLVECFAALLGLALDLPSSAAVTPGIQDATTAQDAPAPGPAGGSPLWIDVLDWARRAAGSALPVLVHGETGAGKEGIARMIHEASPRRRGRFVAVNCAALTETLLEAELFGAVRGAYTGAERDRTGLFQRAAGGTLFLDEVGDMSAALQARLLRVLEERRVRPVGGENETTVDVRIVSATHCDLRRAAAEQRFRADLYHRLAVLEVRVPPLRERLADLPSLVAALVPRISKETGYPAELSPEAWAALHAHAWPGNVRELHTVLARAALRAAGRTLTAEHLGLRSEPRTRARHAPDDDVPLERVMIEQALQEARGSVTRAAARIGWTRQKLYRRMSALSLRRGPVP